MRQMIEELPKEVPVLTEAKAHPRVKMFGMAIDKVDMEQAVETIWSWMDAPEGRYVVTPNIDHVLRFQKDKEFAQIYHEAALVIPDGMPIVWSSRLLGEPLKERVTGSDLFPRICELAAKEDRGVFFLGSMPGVAELAAENLKKRYPGFRLAGFYAPPFGFEKDPAENRKIVEMINASKAEILFVALGAPKQEKWTHRYLPHLETVKAALCVGASIDFEAGVVKRAPHWMRNVGLEWLWRVLNDPKRLWKRYLVDDLPFVGLLLKEWFAARKKAF